MKNTKLNSANIPKLKPSDIRIVIKTLNDIMTRLKKTIKRAVMVRDVKIKILLKSPLIPAFVSYILAATPVVYTSQDVIPCSSNWNCIVSLILAIWLPNLSSPSLYWEPR